MSLHMNSAFLDTSLKGQFLSPLTNALNLSSFSRRCPALSDEDWLLYGVQRSLEAIKSGRDFLQKIGMLSGGVSTYFDSLQSKRRLSLVKDVCARVEISLANCSHDLIEEFIPGLDSYDVWAGDGHWHSHATHDKRDPVSGKYYATGHLYGLNLRRWRAPSFNNIRSGN